MIQIQQQIQNNLQNTNEEFKRVFHGRGKFYGEKYKDITIDSIDTIILISLYKEIDFEKEIIAFVKDTIQNTRHTTIVLQKRYEKETPMQVVQGVLDETIFAIEDGLKIKLNLKNNQNNGYFADMKNGRSFVKEKAKDKNILNLFSYTCAFSLFAIAGGAKSVTNVDMNKNVLSIGRENHRINNFDTKNINFMPYNILKSFSRIKKYAPYDMIIIDPPSFQKGSFIASNDYIKIIKKLDLLSQKGTIILACLNAPELDSQFLIDLFKEHAQAFAYTQKLNNLEEFPTQEEEKSLKNLIFIKK